MFKSGFVSIIGRPNVGKSTFLNSCLGQKISIISPKTQTTRNAIKGIYTDEEAQIVFIDTPGIHKPKNELGEFMNKQALSSLNDSDLVLWMVDSTEEYGSGDMYIKHILEDVKVPLIIAFNKIDKIINANSIYANSIYANSINVKSINALFNENKNKFLDNLNYSSSIDISSLNGTNVDKLIDVIKQNLDEGPMYYPKDAITDEPVRFIASEIIREKIFLLTKEEIPHSVAVIIDDMRADEEGLMNIFATIYVERKSQKKIIIGEAGSMIKKIGTLARKEINLLIGEKTYLELWVKVEEGWRTKRRTLSMLGYK